MYESISYKDIDTTDDINNYKNKLNEDYKSNMIDFIDEFDDNPELISKEIEIRNNFNTLKNNTNKVLNEKLANAWNVVSVTEPITSMTLLSYRYYGNIDNIDTIINLNKNLNTSGFKHPADILSE